MPQLVSVRFRFNPRPLWFDPQGKQYEYGTEVLVETERGREVGVVVDPAVEATEKDISKLKSPLKPIIRELTDLDYEHNLALEEKGRSAMPYFREKVKEYELDIKPVEVQYLFSGERAIFFFSSEERVDFRELVRDLAQHFHVRIDMRQIGARDEAKELGGLAHCGEEFCCTRFGGEFQPVSIRMAKEQDLPLNPTKISGVCGRLMCCLRYEYEAYKDFKKRAPKKGTAVDTPLGEAVISGYNTPSETMELKLEDGKRLNVPLAEMDCQKGSDGCPRCSVNTETIERCASRSMLIALGALDQQLEDALAPQTEEIDIDITDGAQSTRKRRRRSKKGEGSGGEKAAARSSEQSSGDKKPGGGRKRRRRTSEGSASDASTQKRTPQKNQNKAASAPKQSRQKSDTNKDDRPRPGQNSSGLRKRRTHSAAKSEAQTETPRQSQKGSAPKPNNKPNQKTESTRSSTRRPRRRHAGAQNSGQNDKGAQGSSHKDNTGSDSTSTDANS